MLAAEKNALNDVTIIPSVLFSLARFCSPPEVKFHVFSSSKHGKEKSLSNSFLALLISSLSRLYQANEKTCFIFTLNSNNNHPILSRPLEH